MENHIREQELLKIIEEKKYVSIANLSQTMYVSESTIRRDIASLEGKKLVRKTRGGVLAINDQSIEWPLIFKNQINSEKKKHIADLAVDFIGEGQTIFIDSSSTNLFLARKIKKLKSIIVITNGIKTADFLSDETNLEVYSTGGKVYSKRSSLNGARACTYLSKCYVDLAFLTCRGLSANMGATDFSEEEAMVKMTIQQNAKCVILTADSSKFDKIFSHQSIPFENIDVIISDTDLPESIKKKVKNYDIEIVY